MNIFLITYFHVLHTMLLPVNLLPMVLDLGEPYAFTRMPNDNFSRPFHNLSHWHG